MPETTPPFVIVCSSKCLYCGRQTPHECCHKHSEALHPGWWDVIWDADPEGDPMDALWGTGYDKEPESCNDPACPAWGPGEWDRRQAEAAMTPEQRAERLERIRQGIAERRAAHRRADDDGREGAE